MMTPEQSRQNVECIYKILQQKVLLGKINENCVYDIVKQRAKMRAIDHGVPECWRDLMPEILRSELK